MVPDAQADRQLGGKRLLPPHFCHNSLFIPAPSGTAYKGIWIDGIFCSVSSGRRIYVLHRHFFVILTRLSHPLQTQPCRTEHTLACYHSLVASGIPFSLAVFLNLLYLSKADVAKAAGKWQRNTSLCCFWNTRSLCLHSGGRNSALRKIFHYREFCLLSKAHRNGFT